MNTFIQNTLAIASLIIALYFIFGKFVYKPKTNKSKGCEGDGGCDCH